MEDNTQEKMLDQKAIIKKKKRKIAIAGLAIAGVLAFSGVISNSQKNNYYNALDLPTKAQVIQNMDILNMDANERSFLSILDNRDADVYGKILNDENHTYVTRLVPATDGSPIKLNVFMKNLTTFQKNSFLNMAKVLNLEYSFLNDNYKFEVDFNPKLSDFVSEHTINYVDYNFLLSNNVMGQRLGNCKKVGDNFVLTRNFVLIKQNIDNESYEALLMHETGHALGKGDAYLQPTNKTLFSSMNDMNSYLTALDLKMDAALYLNLTDERDLEKYGKLMQAKNQDLFTSYYQKLSRKNSTNKNQLFKENNNSLEDGLSR